MSIQEEPTPEQKLAIISHQVQSVQAEVFLLRAIVVAIAKNLVIDVDKVEKEAVAAREQANQAAVFRRTVTLPPGAKWS